MNALEKVRMIVGGSIHALLDTAIDSMPLPMVNQQIRMLEDALREIDGGVDEATANTRLCQRQLKQYAEESAHWNHVVEDILGDGDPSNDATAEEPAARIVALEALIKQTQDSYNEAVDMKGKLETAQAKLSARKIQAIARRDHLQSTEKQTKSSQVAADWLRKSREMLENTADGGSIDSVVNRAEKQRETAKAALERESAKFDRVATKPTANAEISAKIAEIKRNMEAKAQKPAA